MIKKTIFTILLGGLYILSFGQVAESIQLIGEKTSAKPACIDQYAGEVSMGNVSAQSTNVALGSPIFLCYQDQFTILNSNADLTGDPNNGTLPGVGYGFYSCPPTVTGPNLALIEADPCILDTPAPSGAYNMWVYTDQADGTALFQNGNQLGGMTIPEFFNGGNPFQIYFSPITFDNFNSNADEDGGQCVHTNVSEAFPVVYLNPITISGFTLDVGGNPLAGSFTVEGGLSEYNGSNYPIVKVVKNGIFNNPATVIGGPFMHGDLVNFVLPEEGNYTILIEDNVSCGFSQEFTAFPNDNAMTINIDFPTGPFNVGDYVCAEFSIEDFTQIQSWEFTISFDPNILAYDDINNFNLEDLGIFNFATVFANNGYITASWVDEETVGQTLPDGTVIFQVCFTVIGDPGDCTTLDITDNPTDINVGCCGEELDVELIVNNDELCVITDQFIEIIAGSCSANGSNEGSLHFTVLGGSAPYSYNINPISETGSIAIEGLERNIQNLTAGVYTIIVTDALGAMTNINVVVSDDPSISFDLKTIDPACFGLQNGRIKLQNLTGGTPGYEISWSNGIYNVDSIKSIGGGTYFVTVEDANGCQVTEQAIIGTDPLEVNFNIIDTTTCAQVKDGVITATAGGGTPFANNRYTYKWTMPFKVDNNVSSSTNTGIMNGTVFVEVTDSKGCKFQDSFFMPFKKTVTADIVIDDGDCGTGPGDILVTAGTTNNSCNNFSFTWSANAGTTTNSPNTSMAEGLDEGNYNLQIVDCNGCKLDTIVKLDFSAPLILPALIEFDCSIGTGCIYLFPGGQFPIDIIWGDGNDDDIRCNLPPGEYAVTATDANGCELDTMYTIEEGMFAVDTFLVDHISCPGELDGAIDVQLMGNPIYDWIGPNGVLPNSNTLENLEPGWYYVTISDAPSGCIIIDSVEVQPADSLFVDSVFTLPSCNGEKDGSIALSVTGGNSINGYTFVWADDPNANTGVRTSLKAGTYEVTITDGNGCSIELSLELEDQEQIDIQTNILQGLDCFGETNAIIEAVVSGGKVDNGNYGFIWSTGEIENITSTTVDTAFLFGAPGGQVIVFDEECADTLMIVLTEPSEINIDLATTNTTDASCFGLCDGTAAINVLGGAGNYDYNWLSDGSTTPNVSNLCPGFQVVEIIDDNGCVKLDSVLVDEPDTLIAFINTFETFNPSCNNDGNGQITVSYSGGNQGPVNYTWNNNVSDSEVANDIQNGDYYITITDQNGCMDSISYTLTSPPPVQAEVPIPLEPVCFGEQTCIEIGAVSGGGGPDYRFSINKSSLFPIDTCVNVFAGEYQVSVFDVDGCSYDTTIIVGQPSELQAFLGDEIFMDLGDSTTILELQLSSSFALDTVVWLTNGPYDCLNEDCTKIIVYPGFDTEYSAIAFDVDGCSASDNIVIRVDDERKVYFPTIFSPNGDGINDKFKPYTGLGVVEIKNFQVYDRWGNLMYSLEDYAPTSSDLDAWDGTFNGKVINVGVYAYFVEVEFVDGKVIPYTGSITLVR